MTLTNEQAAYIAGLFDGEGIFIMQGDKKRKET